MALKKSVAGHLLNISKISCQTLTNCRISSSSARTLPSKPHIAPDPGDNGIFRRCLHKRATISRELWSTWIGGNPMERMREIDVSRDRIKLEGLIPPATAISPGADVEEEKAGLTVAEVRKVLRVAQLEMVKTRLREIEKSWIPYSEFVWICGQGCSDPEQGIALANTLDQSGSVIVLGNVVFLEPDQVAKAIEGLIPLPGTNSNDPRKRELEELEKQKSEIDKEADSLVRRELWLGLVYLIVQTAGFMRLTFWELSWDVMEPICCYVTSMYMMAGYAFFLRTAREPSFEGFYQSRFSTKQKRLINIRNFDVQRYNELCKVFYPYSASQGQQASVSSVSFDAPPSHSYKWKPN
ncbi:DUF607 domain-containing protein [Cephalotus follicularis]|uniref:DUF607 domain-containing protein n=1 Tax=Cephalotus follicularis TaxID=3775 RepID=A0A1Q3C969_CEPFO|nr:DUF607 domain-containing protein [Cephalotus follicularis]